jgi:phage/conjugal plasmid C-4 type zinc finger TraR family protein
MADEADFAHEREEAFRIAAINKARPGPSRRNLTGICVECGEQIDPRRLEVMPHAARCIHCA